MGNGHRVGTASADFLENIRSLIARFAEEAELREPEAFAYSSHILMKDSIVAAGEGDVEATQRGKRMGRLLIEQYR